MNAQRVDLYHDHECENLEALLKQRIYEFNSQTTGYFDGKALGGCVRSESGEIIAAFSGYTWGGCCEISHLWVRASHRGRGLGHALMRAAELEAMRRSCEQVVLSTHSFQSHAFYEQLDYKKQAVIQGQPKGHANIVYAKRRKDQN